MYIYGFKVTVIRYLLASLIASLLFGTSAAQTGSTGGSLGKSGKSLSGSQAPTTSGKQNTKAIHKPSEFNLPTRMAMTESSAFGHYTATMIKTGQSEYTANWHHGLVSKYVIVKADKLAVVMKREDVSGYVIKGLGTYRSNAVNIGAVSGQCKLATGVTCNWTLSW